jgi:hypothetical protein
MHEVKIGSHTQKTAKDMMEGCDAVFRVRQRSAGRHFILKIPMREMKCRLPHMKMEEMRPHAKVTLDF